MNGSVMSQRTAITLENKRIAERTYRIRLHEPNVARGIRPGQFIMIRLPGESDPLLGRPFALYDTVLDAQQVPVAIDVVYLIVGKMTAKLAQVHEGDPLEIWGPLGNGFLELGEPEQVTLVAGGIGQTPFLAYTRELLGKRGYGGQPARRKTEHVALYYGVRTANLAAGVEDFRKAGAQISLASDDGSIGYHGFVMQLLDRDGPPSPWIGCGPEPMLHALIKRAQAGNITCHVSLETPMACGYGVCFSCVTRVKTSGGWDYKRVCIDGPVFDSTCLEL